MTQAEGSKLYYCKALSSDSLVITKITDKNILGDKYLGYKYLTDDELMITNYAFNYFNPYTMDKYIAQVEGDTTLNALQEEATFFELVKQNNNKTVAYGYTVDATVQARIEGLAQLERATYQIKAGKNMIAVGKENRYVLTENLAPATFYFKENNETEKGCYYAFIDADDVEKDTKGNVLSFNNKLGVADQSLKALLQEQVIEEVRTSAFRIGLADQPLYRRFNHVELDGAVEGNEDATKLLKFKEAYVGDYLMDETNKNFMREDMDYLGIGAKNIAKAGLSFNVRPFNIGKSAQYQIKPQYLVGDGTHTRQITNVAAGFNDTDAVNVAQLKAVMENAAPKIDFVAGDGIQIEKDSTGTKYTIKANITGGTTTTDITTVTPKANGSGSSKEEGSSSSTGSSDASGQGKALEVKTETKPIHFAADEGTAAVVKPSERLGILGDKTNISTKVDGSNITVSLKKDISVDSVKAGDTTVNKDGVTIQGGPSMTINGVDAGGKKITNVASGTEASDAVNYGQLRDVENKVDRNTQGIYHMNNRISNLDNRVNKVGAGAAALAALHPLDFDLDDGS